MKVKCASLKEVMEGHLLNMCSPCSRVRTSHLAISISTRLYKMGRRWAYFYETSTSQSSIEVLFHIFLFYLIWNLSFFSSSSMHTVCSFFRLILFSSHLASCKVGFNQRQILSPVQNFKPKIKWNFLDVLLISF